jgi:hypothetical protein
MGRYDDAPVIAADGRVLYAPNPRDLATHVSPADNPHEGTLSIGGSWRPYPGSDWYDMVVTVCGPHEGARPPACNAHLQWTLYDDADIDEERVWAAASDVVDAVQDGQSVLVRCYTGQNRSGLVVALAMAHLYGMTGDEAIERLRALRSPTVLCNPTFEQYVREG